MGCGNYCVGYLRRIDQIHAEMKGAQESSMKIKMYISTRKKYYVLEVKTINYWVFILCLEILAIKSL